MGESNSYVTDIQIKLKDILLAPKLAKEQGLTGFKTLINTGKDGGQLVFHIHVHVLGGGSVPPNG